MNPVIKSSLCEKKQETIQLYVMYVMTKEKLQSASRRFASTLCALRYCIAYVGHHVVRFNM